MAGVHITVLLQEEGKKNEALSITDNSAVLNIEAPFWVV